MYRCLVKIPLAQLTEKCVLNARNIYAVSDGQVALVRRWQASSSVDIQELPAPMDDLIVEIPLEAGDPISVLQAALEYLGFPRNNFTYLH